MGLLHIWCAIPMHIRFLEFANPESHLGDSTDTDLSAPVHVKLVWIQPL